MSDKPVKRGLVLQGGGAKGAYAFGCLLALRERQVRIDCVSGTSVGALNAALWSCNQLDHGGEIWGNLSQKAVYPYFRPAFLARAIAPMLVALHIGKSWLQGIELSAKVDTWWSFVICLPMLMAAHIYLAISVAQNRSLGTTISWYSLFMFLWVIWLKRARTSRATRFEIMDELFFAAVLIIGPVVLVGSDEIGTADVMFLLPLAVALCLWGFFIVALWTSRSFLDSRPLKAIIAKVISGSFEIPTYVTCAVARPVFDPDRPRYTPARGHRLIAVSSRSATYLLDPVMTFIPKYYCLNELELSEQNAALAASAALPLGIVKSVSVGGESCVDGGVVDNTPLVPLVSIERCEELIVIELSPLNERSCQHERYKIDWKRLVRRMAISAQEFQSSFDFKHEYQGRPFRSSDPPTEVPYVEPEHWPKRIITLAPKEPLGGFLTGTMNFTPAYARKLIKLGYRDALLTIDNELK